MEYGHDLVRLLGERLDRGESGVVTASPGMGRTHLLGRLAEREKSPRSWAVHGSDRVENVPLVPFSHIFAEMGIDNADPLSIYTSFPRTVASAGDVLLVDDADVLDQSSAVLLTQMSRAGVPMVLSSSSSDHLPPSLRERATRPDWWHEALRPWEDADVLTLAEGLVGAPLDAPTAAALLARARGNPGLVVALLKKDEPVRHSRFAITASVVRLSGVNLAALGDDSRRALAAVAVAGHLPAAAVSPAVVGELTEAGLLGEEAGDVRPYDPLVADIVMHDVDPQRRAVLAASAAAMVAELPDQGRHHRDLLALAGHPQAPADVVAAAFSLTSQGRPSEALDLLGNSDSLALSTEWKFDHAMAEAAALIELGRLVEALDRLDEAAAVAGNDAELVRVAEHWTLVLSGRADDDQALEQRILGILQRFVDEKVRDSVQTGLARRRAILGDRRGTTPQHDSGQSDAVLRALREAMGGSLKVAREIAEPTSAGLAGDDVDLDGLLRVLAQFLTMVYDGDLGHAREVAEAHYARCSREGRPALGLWTYNRAKMAFHAGQYDEAAARSAEAIRHLGWRDVAGQAVPADVMLAASLARVGQQDRADRIVAQLGEVDLQLPRVAIGAARVRAEPIRRAGDSAGAASLLVDAGNLAIDGGEVFSGILAIDEAFMVAPSEQLAGSLQDFVGSTRLFDAYAARAAGVLKKDPVALADAALRLEELYQPGRAAHAWRVAANLWSAARRPVDARRAEQNAVRLTSIWDVVTWPGAERDESKLTPRELDVARLAAQRVRSKEIAEQLSLSTRTVDNHLARAYRKLGVSGRDELAEALGFDA